MTYWNPKKRILLENPGVVRDISGLQKAMCEFWDRKVPLETVIDYLLKSYRHANDREASLEFSDFVARVPQVFQHD
jgi:hypothetical protein